MKEGREGRGGLLRVFSANFTDVDTRVRHLVSARV